MEEEKQMPVLTNNLEREFQRKNKNRKMTIFIIFVLLVLGLIYFLFSYLKTQRELKILKDPAAQEELARVENDKLIKQVSKLIDLPLDQEPVVGTVQDAAALAEQQKFFVNAKNGDRVLIYQDKAIIYRPSDNKLINVG